MNRAPPSFLILIPCIMLVIDEPARLMLAAIQGEMMGWFGSCGSLSRIIFPICAGKSATSPPHLYSIISLSLSLCVCGCAPHFILVTCSGSNGD